MYSKQNTNKYDYIVKYNICIGLCYYLYVIKRTFLQALAAKRAQKHCDFGCL